MIHLADSERNSCTNHQIMILHQFPVFADGLISKLKQWGFRASAFFPQEAANLPTKVSDQDIIFADGCGLRHLMSCLESHPRRYVEQCLSQTIAILTQPELSSIYQSLPDELTRIVSPASGSSVFETAIHKTIAKTPFIDPLLDETNPLMSPRLTPRQLEVLDLVTKGLTSRAIGTRLGISPRTAEKHRANIKAALNANSIIEVILYGQRMKFAA